MKTYRKMQTRLIYVMMIAMLLFVGCQDDSTDVEETYDNLPDITDFPIVGTNQSTSFDNSSEITLPSSGDDFYGQNSNYSGTTPSYTDNGDGTVTDNVTGLMWQNTFDHNGDGTIDYDDKLSYDDILALPNTCTTGEHTDWRVPTIKEQYSLIMFSGEDISSYEGTDTDALTPFINTDYFDFAYGDLDEMERLIDVQCATTAVYASTEVDFIFGVNFADGRIKGYGTEMNGTDKMFNYLLVRGNETYGENSYTDNGDGTVTDVATGLMWMQDDNEEAIYWENALSYAEDFSYAGYTDWRLPDVKELQSIVDYTRSPSYSNSAAIDEVFNCSVIENEAGEDDYPWYWSNTTHAAYSASGITNGGWGAYVAFGRCMGNSGTTTWTDVHGAGAQRSDPKAGDPDDYVDGHGPQGDAIRILNHVRLVRYAN
jgi:hypothetical protein